MRIKLLKGVFIEGNLITVEIDGKQVERKVHYKRSDGLYIVYKNTLYFEYECDYTEVYKNREDAK